MLIRDTLLRDTNLISITYFNQSGGHTPFDRGVGICIRTLTHSAITFLMDFLSDFLFFT